jgi:hypothetical protein
VCVVQPPHDKLGLTPSGVRKVSAGVCLMYWSDISLS